MPRAFLIKAAIGLIAVWIVVVGLAKIAGARVATPERALEIVQDYPLTDDLTPTERGKRIDRLVGIVNRLDFNQRQEMRTQEDELEAGQADMQAYFEAMTAEEKVRFVEETMEHHFKAVMHAFNEMDKEERQKVVARVRRDMEKNDGGRAELEELENTDREIFDKIVQQGVRSYYQEANAEAKMDLAPLLEEMQGRIQGMRGGPR